MGGGTGGSGCGLGGRRDRVTECRDGHVRVGAGGVRTAGRTAHVRRADMTVTFPDGFT